MDKLFRGEKVTYASLGFADLKDNTLPGQEWQHAFADEGIRELIDSSLNFDLYPPMLSLQVLGILWCKGDAKHKAECVLKLI